MPSLPFPTDIASFLVWLAVNGLTVAALLEKLAAFQRLPANVKGAIVFALILFVPYLAQLGTWALGQLPPEQVAIIQTIVNNLILSLQLYAGTQYGHGLLGVIGKRSTG